MANNSTGYGRNWKKWLAIYAAVGVVAYLIIYLVFIYGGSSAAGPEAGCTDRTWRRGRRTSRHGHTRPCVPGMVRPDAPVRMSNRRGGTTGIAR